MGVDEGALVVDLPVDAQRHAGGKLAEARAQRVGEALARLEVRGLDDDGELPQAAHALLQGVDGPRGRRTLRQ